MMLQAQQMLLPAADGGEGGVIQGAGGQANVPRGNGMEGKLVLLLGMLVVTVISLITAGLLLPVHTGKHSCLIVSVIEDACTAHCEYSVGAASELLQSIFLPLRAILCH